MICRYDRPNPPLSEPWSGTTFVRVGDQNSRWAVTAVCRDSRVTQPLSHPFHTPERDTDRPASLFRERPGQKPVTESSPARSSSFFDFRFMICDLRVHRRNDAVRRFVSNRVDRKSTIPNSRRVWFNSRMRPCQGRDDGATPFTRSTFPFVILDLRFTSRLRHRTPLPPACTRVNRKS